jgi:hypothetical protein
MERYGGSKSIVTSNLCFCLIGYFFPEHKAQDCFEWIDKNALELKIVVIKQNGRISGRYWRGHDRNSTLPQFKEQILTRTK